MDFLGLEIPEWTKELLASGELLLYAIANFMEDVLELLLEATRALLDKE